jgi:hypothetical protein
MSANEISNSSADQTTNVSTNVETKPLDQQMIEQVKFSLGSALLYEHTGVLLRIAETGMVIPLPVTSRVLIGRSEINKIQQVNIDLTPFGGRILGVSRRHALIYRMKNSLFLEDLDSVNGTCINGQRLNAGQPRLLRNGDEVCFGNLRCYIEFG